MISAAIACMYDTLGSNSGYVWKRYSYYVCISTSDQTQFSIINNTIYCYNENAKYCYQADTLKKCWDVF